MNDTTISAKPFGYSSQKQKRSNATHKPTHGCFTFAFAPTLIEIFEKSNEFENSIINLNP